MDNKLSIKELLEITVETGLQLVPYVGGPLATAYFSTKNEKRLKRLESFYKELADKIQNREIKLAPFNSHDEESLISLIEDLNDKIESEHSTKKRELFKTFLISAFETPTLESNFDHRKMILDTLSALTYFEFQILLTYSDNHKKLVNEKLLDSDFVDGARARLESFGLLKSYYSTPGPGYGPLPIQTKVGITNFGVKLINFCLSNI